MKVLTHFGRFDPKEILFFFYTIELQLSQVTRSVYLISLTAMVQIFDRAYRMYFIFLYFNLIRFSFKSETLKLTDRGQTVLHTDVMAHCCTSCPGNDVPLCSICSHWS